MDTHRGTAPTAETDEPHRTLSDLRADIDRVDRALLEKLATRFRLAEEVGSLKAKGDHLALDPGREAHIVRKACEAARDSGIPDEGVRQIFWAVIDYCRDGVRGRLQGGGAYEANGSGDTLG